MNACKPQEVPVAALAWAPTWHCKFCFNMENEYEMDVKWMLYIVRRTV